MTRWLPAGSPEWGGLFTSYQASAYRQEGQQFYCSAVQDAALAQFLADRPVEIDLSWANSRTIRQVALGRTLTKVRIVVEPQTPYTRLQLRVYPEMAKAGEDIRILAVQMGDWPDGLPHHDYWFFDDRDLYRMHYHENYYFKGAELIVEPNLVDQHRRARDLALAQAVPLDDYLATQERTSA